MVFYTKWVAPTDLIFFFQNKWIHEIVKATLKYSRETLSAREKQPVGGSKGTRQLVCFLWKRDPRRERLKGLMCEYLLRS